MAVLRRGGPEKRREAPPVGHRESGLLDKANWTGVLLDVKENGPGSMCRADYTFVTRVHTGDPTSTKMDDPDPIE